MTAGCDSWFLRKSNQKAAVTVNNLQLTLTDLREELESIRPITEENEVGPGGEPVWVSYLIDRELLVQEAQKLGLDREPEFMRTIEHFWKEALLKGLLNRKGKEISARVQVLEPEIEAYYEQLAAKTEGQLLEPLEEIRDEIRHLLQKEKEAQVLDEWIADLRKRSRIEVDIKALAELQAS